MLFTRQFASVGRCNENSIPKVTNCTFDGIVAYGKEIGYGQLPANGRGGSGRDRYSLR